jgi:hypothetical protein
VAGLAHSRTAAIRTCTRELFFESTFESGYALLQCGVTRCNVEDVREAFPDPPETKDFNWCG